MQGVRVGIVIGIQWEKNNTLDSSNISTITLVFIKLFSKAKNVHLIEIEMHILKHEIKEK